MNEVEDVYLLENHPCTVDGNILVYGCPNCHQNYHEETGAPRHRIYDCWEIHLKEFCSKRDDN